jgi:hypothetical protein
MTVKVQCYAGHKADERPVRFQLGERDYLVIEVVDQWYGPDATFFKLRADDGNLYILRHGHPVDEWTLESFRREG